MARKKTKPKKVPRPVMKESEDRDGYEVEWGNVKLLFMIAKNGDQEVYVEAPLTISPLLPRFTMVFGAQGPF